MKILMISHEYPPIGGGGANACRFLSRVFISEGHEVTLVSAHFQGLVEREDEEGLKIFRLRAKRKRKDHCSFTEMADFVTKAMPFAAKLHKKRDFDVCMIFFGIPSGVVGLSLKKKFDLPYIVRFGGGDIPGFQDRFKVIYKFIGPYVRRIWKHSSALVANSSGLRDFAMRFCSDYPIEVIPNGVDVDFFRPADVRDEGDLRLIFVSRLLERKGLQDLIPHLMEIEEQCGRRVSLTVVGDGPYRPELERLVSEGGLEDRVVFMGQRDKEELPALYENADLFVFPSRREGMPNVVLEAMAAALPVVMTPCEGAAELIDDNGIVVREEFYRGVIRAVNSGKLRQMGEAGRKRAMDRFSWRSSALAYLDIMKKTCGQ